MSQPVEAIDRTPEYDDFMSRLAEFHKRKGTTLQPEPVLGGKKLDLLRIYKTVIDAGGCEAVTQNRGWKQVGDPFNFPPTCTNSAYILKSVYMKNLVGWEEEEYWKRPWNPPKELLEINIQSLKTASPKVLNTATRPRDIVRQTATAFIQPAQNMPRPIHNPPLPRPMPFINPMDEELQNRIIIALQSTLPNEVDWAFNELVAFSYFSENFCLDFVPSLLDLLLGFTDKMFDGELVAQQNNENLWCDPAHSVFNDKASEEQMERVHQVFHIIRNFSFLEINVRPIVRHEKLQERLMVGIGLPEKSEFSELSRYCLDILENISPQIILNGPQDPYLEEMIRLVHSDDRTLILGAIRALTRVAVAEINERIVGSASASVITRMSQFLLIDDEELVAATLEYLYQHAGLTGRFATVLVHEYPGDLVGLLTGYLSYKSTLIPNPASAMDTIHGLPSTKSKAPAIPDLTDYFNLDEPYRCLGWLKDKIVGATLDDTLVLREAYKEYETLFGGEKPLGLKEFYTVLKIAFPQPEAVELAAANATTGLGDIVLHKIKYKLQAGNMNGQALTCRWMECEKSFDTEPSLHKHIVQDHVDTQENEPRHCRWMSCDRHQFTTRQSLLQHLRTHFSNRPRPVLKKPARDIQKTAVDDSEISGVPLTAALLLRSLAKHKQNHVYYLPHQCELTLLAIQRPKLSKYILTALDDLQVI